MNVDDKPNRKRLIQSLNQGVESVTNARSNAQAMAHLVQHALKPVYRTNAVIQHETSKSK